MRPTEYEAEFVNALGSSGEVRLKSSDRLGRPASEQTIDYRIDASKLFVPPGNPPDRLCDTLDLLQAIYIVDCLCPRTVPADLRPLSERWRRKLTLTLPLRDPAYWLTGDASRVLQALLDYLTGDEWAIEPTRHTISQPRPARRLFLLPSVDPEEVRVVLHSGGIDSLLGLASTAVEYPTGLTIAASASTHPRVGALQRRVLNALRAKYPSSQLASATTGYSLRHELRDKEPSQRTRILRSVVAGVMAAVAFDGRELIVAENGPGAINLPSSVLDAAAHVSRGVHPYTLQLLSELISHALGETFTIHNPLLTLTKGEVVSNLSDLGLGQVVELTNSCDRFPYGSADRHCGTCSSCVLRSIALWHLPETRHLISRVLMTERSSALTHYQMSAWRLDQAIHSADPVGRLARFDQAFDRVLSEVDVSSCLAMLARHRDEILAFADTPQIEAA